MASNATGSSDTAFVQDAAIGGLSEVELGKIASTKAANAEVKKFGQMMVTDHSKANEELKALAQKKGWTLPTEPDSSHKSTMEDLRNRVGADFDQAYVDEMVDDHEEDVAAFEDKAKNATDPDLKAFAEKTLPVLRKHLDAIKAIQAKMSSAPANK
jgi:putative membrane protein